MQGEFGLPLPRRVSRRESHGVRKSTFASCARLVSFASHLSSKLSGVVRGRVRADRTTATRGTGTVKVLAKIELDEEAA